MSEGLGLLLAIAILIVLFSILLAVFQEKHELLRYVFIMGILVSGFFIPSAVYELRTNCDFVVSNSTIVDASVTTYSYSQECFSTLEKSDTQSTFYQVMWSLYQIVIVYFIVRLLYLLFNPLWERLKRW